MKKILRKIVVYILQKEAQAVLKKYKPQIVGITGSVGKTSTKDAIYSALSNFYFCRKSQKSFNSELGVPLTILGRGSVDSVDMSLRSFFGWAENVIKGLELILFPSYYPEWLILEIGTDRPGDIEEVTKWVKPDIVVVTKLSKTPVHVEFFPTVQDVYKEKGNLVKALKPGGTLILNADDEDVLEYKNLTDEKILLFGNKPEADIRGGNYEVIYENHLPAGIKFKIYSGVEKFETEIHDTLGAHHSYHVLAALAATKALNADLEIALKAIEKHESTPGRMRLIPGLKNTMIIDDSYNSSSIALTEALNALKSLQVKRKIAVVGDMLELGRFSKEAHKKAGEEVKDIADILLTVGPRARTIAESALNFGMDEKQVFQFEDSQKAGDFLQNIIEKGDVILVKGSQGVRMEKTVEEIMAEPEKKQDLLVRQDGFWKNK